VKITIRSIVNGLILIIFMLTPIFGWQELLTSFPGFSGIMSSGPMVLIKIIKDLVLGIIAVLFMIDLLVARRKLVENAWLWLLMGLLLLSAASTYFYEPMMAIVGVRVFSPFILVFVSYRFFDLPSFRRIKNVLFAVCLLEFAVALVQRSFFYGMPALFGSRVFGTFTAPGAFAAFICYVLCLQMGDDLARHNKVKIRTWVFYLLSIVFILFAASGGGLVSLAVIAVVYFLVYARVDVLIKYMLVPVILIIPLVAFSNLPLLTGRNQIISESGSTRLSIFVEMISTFGIKEMAIGKGLGIGSNAAATIQTYNIVPGMTGDEDILIADSFYASALSQVGLVFLVAFIVFMLNRFLFAWRNKMSGINPTIILTVPLILVTSMTGIITESFPLNWLIFILFGVALKEQDNNNAA